MILTAFLVASFISFVILWSLCVIAKRADNDLEDTELLQRRRSDQLPGDADSVSELRRRVAEIQDHVYGYDRDPWDVC